MNRKAVDPTLQYSHSAEGQQTEIPAFLPLLAGCLHLLPQLPQTRFVPAGSVLIDQGCSSGTVYLIASGVAKLEYVSVHGRQTTIGLRSEGWYAGSLQALLALPSLYAVRTVTDCMVVKISGSEFTRLLRDSPEMSSHFQRGLCLEVASQASLNAEVMAASAEERLEHFMRERESSRTRRKTLDPMPMLKQMELAQLLSITPEHLSRLMNRKRGVTSSPSMAARPREVRALGVQRIS